MNARNDTLDLIGRILLAVLFLMSGISKITGYQETLKMVVGVGVPMPEVAFPLAIAFELLGAIGLILGLQTRLAAALLIVFTVLATYFFHAFWKLEGDAAMMERVKFFANMALAGGLFVVMANGAGRFSIDGRRR